MSSRANFACSVSFGEERDSLQCYDRTTA